MKRVPNELPTTSAEYRLAIIGEAPGENEELEGRPFVGQSGRLLHGILSRVGILRSACLLGNVCQFRPPSNNIWNYRWDGPEISDGVASLADDLKVFNPNAVLLLGATAYRLTSNTLPFYPCCGSIYLETDSSSILSGIKYIPSHHPAFCLRAYDHVPLLAADVARAKEEALTPLHTPPRRKYDLELTSKQIVEKLNSIQDGATIALDIEGRVEPGENITCISIALSSDYAFIIPMLDFPTAERESILPALARVLANPRIGKVLQNCLYDEFCLQWRWKMPISGIVHDTMISGAEIYPEIPKSLQMQTRIWTKEPYYKYERKLGNPQTLYKYCCTDSMVTHEIHSRHKEVFINAPKAKAHFDFNMQLLPAFRYMQHRGMRYDVEGAKERCREIEQQLDQLNAQIDAEHNFHINPNCNNGPNALSKVLYNKLGYPAQYKKERAKDGSEVKRLTADADALLELIRGNDDPFIMRILKWKGLEKDRQYLMMGVDKDNRVRCSYNICGAETFRVSCAGSASGSGTNLQTIKSDHRDLFLADEGMDFAQYDLSGADGWTVAAHCAALGDPTMLDDYSYPGGIKPAKVLALMYTHGMDIVSADRSSLVLLQKEVKEDGSWLYPTCKRVQHGSNYLMGERRMADVVKLVTYKETNSPIFVSPRQCKQLQQMYLSGRYRAIPLWQAKVKDQLQRTRRIESASGHVRIFMGRENSDDTWKEALAQEPQHNTTYATNLALHRLWYDPDNRDSMNRLIIEPIHQVHDALCVQWPTARREWALRKMDEYFNNPLQIACIQITIPAAGGYGPNWKETKSK